MAASGVVMTAFLWHLTAIVVANALVVESGLPTPQIGSAAWWYSRPLLLGLALIVLFVLVVVFRRFETPHETEVVTPQRRRAHRGGLATTGLALAVLGVLGFSMTGFSGVTTLHTETLVVLPMTPFLNLVLLLVGWWVVQWSASPVAPLRVPPSRGSD